MLKICIIIPCFNEEKRLPVEEFENFIANSLNIDFCFVNDGSKDDTIIVLNKLREKFSNRIIINDLKQNVGKAEAVRNGFLEILKNNTYQYVGFMDADLATPLSEIALFEEFINNFPDKSFFLGSRIKRLGSKIERTTIRHYFGRVFATFASIILKLGVYDTQCGAKLIKSDLAEKIFAEPLCSRWLFDIELIFRTMIYYGRQVAVSKMIEIPLNNWYEKGESKISPLYFFKVPLELLKIKNHYKKFKP